MCVVFVVVTAAADNTVVVVFVDVVAEHRARDVPNGRLNISIGILLDKCLSKKTVNIIGYVIMDSWTWVKSL